MNTRFVAPVMAASLLSLISAQATVYTDSAGEEFSGNGHLDILQVEILNDASDISFAITLAGDPIANDWGKYLVAIDSVPGGDSAGNGWSRPISMASGMDYWIGSWVDFGDGAEVWEYGAAGPWAVTQATYNAPPNNEIAFPAKTTSTVTLTTTLASLGLGVGDSFLFDVFTTAGGGSDSANDALSDPAQSIADWSGPYTSTSTLSYSVIPEPATFTMILVGLGAMVARKFRRR